MKKHTENAVKAGLWCLALSAVIAAILMPFFHFDFDWREPLLSEVNADITVLGFCAALASLLYFLVTAVFAFFYRETPQQKDSGLPKCSVIVPAFNEGEYVLTTLRSVMNSNYPSDKLEIIAVNDGSSDDTWDWIQRGANEFPGRIRTLNLLQNGGKRRALYEGFQIASGEIAVTVDSDSAITENAIRALVAPFQRPEVGAVAGNIRVSNCDEGFIPKIMEAAFGFGFEMIRCAQSFIGSVLCTPGALSAYRLSAIRPLLDEWVNQTFMGRPSGIGEDRAITSMILRERWRVEYQSSAEAYTKMPVNYRTLCKMLIRWTRSDVRENLVMLGVVLRRFEPFNYELVSFQLGMIFLSMNLLLPLFYIPLWLTCLVVSPLPFIFYSTLTALVWSGIPAVICVRRNGWLDAAWAFAFGLYSLPCLTWICVYSLLTVGNSQWMTRGNAVRKHRISGFRLTVLRLYKRATVLFSLL